MGLDMFVTRIRKIPNMTMEEVRQMDIHRYKKDLKKYDKYLYDNMNYDGTSFKAFASSGIYWRKANAIHKWFVENVQDGIDDNNECVITIDHLKSLKEVCENVLEDNGMAEELLPTVGGFFFGSTEYDEYYFEDLEHTVTEINSLLKEFNEENEWLTYNSWW